MSFYNGILHLTNWLGNVIMPTMAGLLFAVAIVRYSKGYPWNYSMWAAVAALSVSGHDRKCFRKSWGLVPALSFVGSCHFKLRAVPDSGSSQLEHELFHLRTPPLTQKGSSCLNRQVPLA